MLSFCRYAVFTIIALALLSTFSSHWLDSISITPHLRHQHTQGPSFQKKSVLSESTDVANTMASSWQGIGSRSNGQGYSVATSSLVLQTRKNESSHQGRIHHHPLSRSKLSQMDLEDGVRLGSLCGGATKVAAASRSLAHGVCPVADDVLAELELAERAESAPAEADLCLYTSLTESYVEGHLVFMRSALRHTPLLASTMPPLYVLDQSLSAAAQQRVRSAYSNTRLVKLMDSKDVAVVTKFALNKVRARTKPAKPFQRT